MKKTVIKSICFFIVLLFVLFLTSQFLTRNKYVRGVKIDSAGIKLERDNSIDYIVLGDSVTYTSIIPLEIYNDYGYTGYILGSPAQRLKQTKEKLTSSLENQNPKLLILETNAIFRKNKSKNPKTSLSNMFTDIYQLHDTWKYYINPKYKTYSGNEKGYVYSTKVRKAPIKNKLATEKRAKIPEYNIELFEEILDICKKNNIEIILVSTPSAKNWSYKKHNSIYDIAKKYNVKFIDLNLDDKVLIDWESDTQDEGDHLNYYGAYKTTKVLGEYIDELNILTDHRGEEGFSDWDDCYEKYQLKFNNE